MCSEKDKIKTKLDIDCVRKAYYALKDTCYDCNSSCDHCKFAAIREELAGIEEHLMSLLGEGNK